MNIRQLFRRRTTTTPADPARPPVPAWEQDDHFQVGEMVQLPPDPDGTYNAKVEWVEGDRVGILTNPRNGAQANASRDQVRHVTGCEPCMADATAQDTAEEERENAYWERWPEEERELHDAVMEDLVVTGTRPRRYRFGDRSPVREWMRTELDGHLLDDEMPALSLGRIWDPLDWPRIEQEHGDDGLTISNPWKNVPWTTIRAAFTILRDAGCTPALDVCVEMDLLDDGTIGADVVVTSLQVENPIDDATYEQVVALLGDATEYPYCHTDYPMKPDGPGRDYSQPYKASEYTATGWNWSGGASWTSPFNPPATTQEETT